MTLFRQIEIPTDLPISLAFKMDRRALVFSFIVAVASALAFGLVPAIQASRTDLVAVMKAGDTVRAGPPALGTRDARHRTGGRLGRRARRRDVHVSRFQQRTRSPVRATGPITC